MQQNVMAVTYRRPAMWKGSDKGELAAPTTPPSPRVVRIYAVESQSRPASGGALYLWAREYAAHACPPLSPRGGPPRNLRLDSVLWLRLRLSLPNSSPQARRAN